MKTLISFLAAILFLAPFTYAQVKIDPGNDEIEIRELIQKVEAAWANGDAVKYADCFADDVDFTVWNGYRYNGREQNIAGHQRIFDTIYKGTAVDLEIEKIRKLSDNLAVVLMKGGMTLSNGEAKADVPKVRPMAVLEKTNGKWLIVVFQNTPVIKEGELVLGGKNR